MSPLPPAPWDGAAPWTLPRLVSWRLFRNRPALSTQGWNLQSLSSLLSRTLDENKLAIPGVSTSYLYFGMWRSLFAWYDLLSSHLQYTPTCIRTMIQPPWRDMFRTFLCDYFALTHAGTPRTWTWRA